MSLSVCKKCLSMAQCDVGDESFVCNICLKDERIVELEAKLKESEKKLDNFKSLVDAMPNVRLEFFSRSDADSWDLWKESIFDDMGRLKEKANE